MNYFYARKLRLRLLIFCCAFFPFSHLHTAEQYYDVYDSPSLADLYALLNILQDQYKEISIPGGDALLADKIWAKIVDVKNEISSRLHQ